MFSACDMMLMTCWLTFLIVAGWNGRTVGTVLVVLGTAGQFSVSTTPRGVLVISCIAVLAMMVRAFLELVKNPVMLKLCLGSSYLSEQLEIRCLKALNRAWTALRPVTIRVRSVVRAGELDVARLVCELIASCLLALATMLRVTMPLDAWLQFRVCGL